MKDFYKAWWYLEEHPMFQDKKLELSRFQECLDIEVHKVNPKTGSIDDNKELNTKVEVWLECGEWDEKYGATLSC